MSENLPNGVKTEEEAVKYYRQIWIQVTFSGFPVKRRLRKRFDQEPFSCNFHRVGRFGERLEFSEVYIIW